MALNPVKFIEVNSASHATVLQVISEKHQIKTGFVCISDDDIVCVDGVCNRDGRYWTIEVNGDFSHVNSLTLVEPTDRIVLKYASSTKK